MTSLTRRELLRRGATVLGAAVVSRWTTGCQTQTGRTISTRLRAQIGAYYFNGWAGRNKLAGNPDEPWAKDAPTHLTRRLVEEFPEREPVWGWRDDSLAVMERQIDLAADHGLAFWAFCWYFNTDAAVVAQDPKHTGLQLFLQAPNNRRMKFCLLVANHAGYKLETLEHWKKAATLWFPYLTHPQHVTVAGKPLVMIFNAQDSDPAGFAHLQEVARAAGLPGVAIAACSGNPPNAGFTHTTHYNVGIGWEAGLEQRRYRDLTETVKQSWKGTPEQPHIPCLVAGWDKRPWESKGDGKHSWYFPDRTPEQFGAHVADVVAWMDAHPDQTTAERLAVIYAWNEFGEGGYIAPTKGDPSGEYLKALRSVVVEQKGRQT